MDYSIFFQKATGRVPYPYQVALGQGEWPELVDVPTGLGKTAALGVAWLYRRAINDASTPRRLVWCLPMRSLVEQTYDEFNKWVEAAGDLFDVPPSINILMGGDQELIWAEQPERDAVVIGTQDMLISRALMRGYGMSRYAWPMHYAWLHNDALWVFDETQLMGVSVSTSAQLEGFRQKMGTAAKSHSIWMSATLSDDPINTVDHRPTESDWHKHTLSAADMDSAAVIQRVNSSKTLYRANTSLDREATKKGENLDLLAQEIIGAHIDDSLTLVVMNRVSRAQDLFQELKKYVGDDVNIALIHSRYRPGDRRRQFKALQQEGSRIVVATQVIEAGVDISARTLFTELAPWSSLVQRFGRCNRYGECDEATVFWIDMIAKDEKDGDVLLPYILDDFEASREILSTLKDVGPRSLKEIEWEAPQHIWPIVRRRDILELFDTTTDLSGNDLDISRYVRDGDDTDISFYWRVFDGKPQTDDLATPHADELCRVSINQARSFVSKKNIEVWRFMPLDATWQLVTKDNGPRPGELLLVESSTGGYDPELGYIGPPKSKKYDAVPPIVQENSTVANDYQADKRTFHGRWITLQEHTDNVVEQTRLLCEALHIDAAWKELLMTAALWHDVGKAHDVFQNMLLKPKKGEDTPPVDAEILWAKSDHQRGRSSRKYFRHELASALAYLQLNTPSTETNLVAYLIAAHHGKVRLSIRSLPGEKVPDTQQLFARGIWHNDLLRLLDIADFDLPEKIELDLSPMQMGMNSWLDRCLQLRDSSELGPFKLAYLESILRLADHRASALEQQSRSAAPGNIINRNREITEVL